MKSHLNLEFASYFKELEQNYPVDQWRIGDIYIWPYIRIKLYLFLLSEQINRNKEVKVDKSSLISRKKIKYRSFKKIVKLLKAIINHQVFFSKLQKKKIVFVGSHFHRVEEQGVAFNRFFDSMVKSNHLENDVYFLEYQKIIENSFNNKAIINLEKQINAFKKINKIFKFKNETFKNVELYKYDLFLKQLKKDHIEIESLSLEIDNLIGWVRKIITLSNFYIQFFKKVFPEKLIFCGYYGWDNLYAAIYSANKLGIKTIDFQHGPQTNHMVFSEWNKIPNSGYSLMPKEYWVWDQESKINLEKWTSTRNDILVKLAGHSYLQYKKSRISKIKGNIVFSMQTFPLERMIPKEILELIKVWNYKWIFRLHPRNAFPISEIVAYFDRFGIKHSSYILEAAYEKPLPETLLSASLHFSAFSGCTLEARSLEVPTILIDPVGNDMFKNYIDEKFVYFLNPKSNNFFQKVEHILSKSILNRSNINESKIINPLYF